MDEAMKWGPFLIKISWVTMIVSGLFGYLLVNLLLKRSIGEKKDQIIDIMGNSIFIGLGIWKLSLLLMNPISVWNNPTILLYFSGGYRGWIMAILAVFVYLLYQSKKQKLSIWEYFRWFGLGFSAANFVYHVLFLLVESVDRWFHLGQMVLSILFAVWFLRGQSANSVFQGVVWFGIGQIFIYFFKGMQLAIWLGLSQYQIIFLVITLLGFLGSWVQKKEISFNES